jgi:beta-carotene hydroxylase
MHHRDTNDSEFDPDHWVKVSNPLRVLLRCLTIVPYYNHYFFKMVVFRPEVPGNKKLSMQVIASYWILYTVAFWIAVTGHWREVLDLWLLPHILASALIIFFFAYLTHQPHRDTDRYRDTNIFWVKGRLAGPLVNWLYLFQNYHLIHHLFPRVPFYLYGNAFKDLKPVLDREHAHIYEIGH